MATIAKGVATFTNGGSETASFTWVDVLTNAPVTFAATPVVGFPSLTVTTGGQGPGFPYFNGAAAYTNTGGTFTMANPPDGTVTVMAVG